MPILPKTSPESAGTTRMLGPYTYIEPEYGHKVTDGPLLLCDFILPLGEGETVIDIGTGAGVIPLMLAWKTPVKRIVGVEVQRALAETAGKNVELNSLNDRIEIIEGDYRDLPKRFPESSFSLVLANPPFVKRDGGRRSPDASRDTARSEVFGVLEDLLQTSAYLASGGGRVAYIFPVIRLKEMLSGLTGVGLTPTRLRFIHATPKSGAALFLVEASRSGTLEVEAPLILPVKRETK